MESVLKPICNNTAYPKEKVEKAFQNSKIERFDIFCCSFPNNVTPKKDDHSIEKLTDSPDSGFTSIPSDTSTDSFHSEKDDFDAESEKSECADSAKIEFMSALGLLEKTCSVHEKIVNPVVDLQDLDRNKGKRSGDSLKKVRTLKQKSKRILLRNFVKTNRILSLSSTIGQRFVKQYDILAEEEMTRQTLDNEQFCKTGDEYEKKCESEWKVVTKKKHILPDDSCHKYSFKNAERITRDSEIVVGLNSASFKNFNKCKPLSIVVEKLTDDQITKLTVNKKPLIKKNFMSKLEWFVPVVRIQDASFMFMKK